MFSNLFLGPRNTLILLPFGALSLESPPFGGLPPGWGEQVRCQSREASSARLEKARDLTKQQSLIKQACELCSPQKAMITLA